MKTKLKWSRLFPDSANNFDLVLENPQDLDSEQMNTLLDAVLEETHRGLSLSARAVTEFRRWFAHPDSPLKSEAYVLLSNWFMTRSGDRHSAVATRAEALWDNLFSCRPANRLSSPEPGRNHVVIPSQFQDFWRSLSMTRGGEPEGGEPSEMLVTQRSANRDTPELIDVSGNDRLRAKFEKEGLHCEVEGSSRAVADFLKRVSGWPSGQP